jgi:leucyl-tRNA synthetase
LCLFFVIITPLCRREVEEMMTEHEKYNPQAIEPRWQQQWEQDELYRAKVDWSKPKYYALTMLPYPSGDLHIGHWFAMTPSDARARYMRMKGFNVLFPMGFDAFGLPAENAAIQRGIHPAPWTHANIERMRGQIKSMGAMFDWQREAVSCEPEYYRWTEWFFKQFYENDLAYRGEALVNWSPTLQTVLANEQVIDGKDERTGQPVVQKLLTQWFFRMTKYADELLEYTDLDYPEPIKTMQTNWIGRSEGARVVFHTEQGNHPIEIFTTRPDTLWGATFMVLSPEHPLVAEITTDGQRDAVDAYIEQAARETELERTSDDREKTGVFTGAYAINPVNDEHIPIWIADYVLISYGTGAIMAVPAHDERDFAFARKYGLPIRVVIQPEGEELSGETMEAAHAHEGVMVNSGRFNGTKASNDKGRKNPAISAVIDWIEEKGIGKEAINYRMRDWLISRQRYWGSPIPIIYREDGKIEAVPDDQLPVRLPEDVKMTGVGNPLAQNEGFRQHGRFGREACTPRNRHTGHFPVLVVVLVPLPESALRRLPVRPGRGGVLAARRYLLWRGGTRCDAPAVCALVHESDARIGNVRGGADDYAGAWARPSAAGQGRTLAEAAQSGANFGRGA